MERSWANMGIREKFLVMAIFISIALNLDKTSSIVFNRYFACIQLRSPQVEIIEENEVGAC